MIIKDFHIVSQLWSEFIFSIMSLTTNINLHRRERLVWRFYNVIVGREN